MKEKLNPSFCAVWDDSKGIQHELYGYSSMSSIKRALRKKDVLAFATIYDKNQVGKKDFYFYKPLVHLRKKV